MIAVQYQFTEKELKELLSSIVVVVDTREQQNSHILQYFDKRKIPYVTKKVDTGDYTCYLPANPALGIMRDTYFSVALERKNSVDELATSIKDRSRFENELIRSQLLRFTMIVEDLNGYENILKGNYRSQYEPKALLASLKSFEMRYGFTTVFLSSVTTAHYIYSQLYYSVRNYLKGGGNIA